MTQNTARAPQFAHDNLVIASHNRGKVAEFSTLLAPLNISVHSASDMKLHEPEETGNSFAENAMLKAQHAVNATGLPSLADDSGLAVDALGGAPGIYSARWAGPDKDFTVAFERIRKELQGASETSAHFVCMLALCIPGEQTQLFEGRISGALTFPPRGEKGFGYDPIFIPEGHQITFAEMNPADKNVISHRARAFAKFMDYMKGSA